ncbi:hypothetical protein CC2G_014244 [Coprinopsis cinerea AmutBmut pab1-1]|nr:hypothetical protein CC2G_014244 [Coprinopsis cinerea AmutBmut pab1-1]
MAGYPVLGDRESLIPGLPRLHTQSWVTGSHSSKGTFQSPKTGCFGLWDMIRAPNTGSRESDFSLPCIFRSFVTGSRSTKDDSQSHKTAGSTFEGCHPGTHGWVPGIGRPGVAHSRSPKTAYPVLGDW